MEAFTPFQEMFFFFIFFFINISIQNLYIEEFEKLPGTKKKKNNYTWIYFEK